MKLTHGALCGMAIALMTAQGAEMPPETPAVEGDADLPQPLKSEAFEGLLANSPFTRSLGISDSLILTGVARFNNEVHATLMDTQTMESHVVTKTPNREGWQLIAIGGDPAQMHTWTAKIQMQGGQITVIRYQKPPPKPTRSGSSPGGSGGGPGGSGPNGSPRPLNTAEVEEAKKAAVNYKEGFTSDGYPRQPPPEMVEKLSRLSVQQREDINRQMIGIRNTGMGMEERRRIYENMVDRASGRGR
ncbi:hypothetical protein DES53_11926 [Roseimicrobium gellanilyticum]|uniref:Uncharacterized protein n=1 Tax=Roseimicrobium gellanilyticum TaxID=748857 RepID=A0A366H1U5_9BACT|nr:hypothetical protein [Roseimicrobium gellanilyticum]RBP35860.1 hypothetical protein DES53_11926 [Roseimicrobium gellanilyticum]